MTTSELSIDRTYPRRRIILLVVGLVGLAFALHEHLLPVIQFALSNLWQMTPIVLAGLLVTAVLTATGSIGLLVATFDAREFLAIVMVSLIGAVLPVCGITLLPLVAGLLGAGMPLAPVMAFLLSSAVTDPSMFAVTVTTLGLPFAVGKSVAAFVIGMLGGGVTSMLVRIGWFERPVRESPMLQSLVPESACCGPTETTVHWRFWQDPERLALFRETGWSMAKLVVLFFATKIRQKFISLLLWKPLSHTIERCPTECGQSVG